MISNDIYNDYNSEYGYFDTLNPICSSEELLSLTKTRTLELGFGNESSIPIDIKDSFGDHLVLLNNIPRAIEYASKNAIDVDNPEVKPFKATGKKSMWSFGTEEYIGYLEDSRFMCAVNFRPFYNSAGIIIPKPSESGYVEPLMQWDAVNINDLSFLKDLSRKGVSIWNAMSSPSSPFLHFQFIPNDIECMTGTTTLPIVEAIRANNYSQNQIYLNSSSVNLQVFLDEESALFTLQMYEGIGIASDLLIVEGVFLLIPKQPTMYIVHYPWGTYWKPTAERLGFIFHHPSMNDFLNDGNFVRSFWETNNRQVLPNNIISQEI